MRITTLLLFSALLTLAACASPTDQRDNSVHASVQGVTANLIDEGIYETIGALVDVAAPNTAAGKIGEHEGLKLVRSTRTVSIEKGIKFGYRFRLRSDRDGPMHGFEMHVEHPPMRGVDGKIHTSQTARIDLEFVNGALDHDIIYVLSEEFEMLPGTWKLEIHLDGRPVISRAFTLRK